MTQHSFTVNAVQQAIARLQEVIANPPQPELWCRKKDWGFASLYNCKHNTRMLVSRVNNKKKATTKTCIFFSCYGNNKQNDVPHRFVKCMFPSDNIFYFIKKTIKLHKQEQICGRVCESWIVIIILKVSKSKYLDTSRSWCSYNTR